MNAMRQTACAGAANARRQQAPPPSARTDSRSIGSASSLSKNASLMQFALKKAAKRRAFFERHKIFHQAARLGLRRRSAVFFASAYR